jgi:hypothetical protein
MSAIVPGLAPVATPEVKAGWSTGLRWAVRTVDAQDNGAAPRGMVPVELFLGAQFARALTWGLFGCQQDLPGEGAFS